jgi:hypothetical protein
MSVPSNIQSSVVDLTQDSDSEEEDVAAPRQRPRARPMTRGFMDANRPPGTPRGPKRRKMEIVRDDDDDSDNLGRGKRASSPPGDLEEFGYEDTIPDLDLEGIDASGWYKGEKSAKQLLKEKRNHEAVKGLYSILNNARTIKRNELLTTIPTAQAYLTARKKNIYDYQFEEKDLDDDPKTPDDVIITHLESGQPFSISGYRLLDRSGRAKGETIRHNYLSANPTPQQRKENKWIIEKRLALAGTMSGWGALTKLVNFAVQRMSCLLAKLGASDFGEPPNVNAPVQLDDRSIKTGNYITFKYTNGTDCFMKITQGDYLKIIKNFERVIKECYLFPLAVSAFHTGKFLGENVEKNETVYKALRPCYTLLTPKAALDRLVVQTKPMPKYKVNRKLVRKLMKQAKTIVNIFIHKVDLKPYTNYLRSQIPWNITLTGPKAGIFYYVRTLLNMYILNYMIPDSALNTVRLRAGTYDVPYEGRSGKTYKANVTYNDLAGSTDVSGQDVISKFSSFIEPYSPEEMKLDPPPPLVAVISPVRTLPTTIYDTPT